MQAGRALAANMAINFDDVCTWWFIAMWNVCSGRISSFGVVEPSRRYSKSKRRDAAATSHINKDIQSHCD